MIIEYVILCRCNINFELTEAMLDKHLTQNDLDALYGWVDTLNLSRPKKHINRDFSDAVMMAQTICNFFPKFVELHNYPASNSVSGKISNWKTLNTKSLSKLGIPIKNQDCQKLATASPMAIEVLLFEFMKLCGQQEAVQQQNQRTIKGYPTQRERGLQQKNQVSSKRKTGPNPNKAQQLRQILKIIKDKIGSVQKSIQKKDIQIRQLEQLIQMGS